MRIEVSVLVWWILGDFLLDRVVVGNGGVFFVVGEDFVLFVVGLLLLFLVVMVNGSCVWGLREKMIG